MASRVLVFDRSGLLLTDIETNVKRTWKIGEHSKAEFTLATSDANCSPDYLHFGNYLVILHDKLPTWGGMVDPPRKWRPGQVSVTAYSGEYILTTRRGMKVSKESKGTPGELFSKVLQEANDQESTLLREGVIYTGGKAITFTIGADKLYPEVRKLADESGCEWFVEPVISETNRLHFVANWYLKAGIISMCHLHNKNMELGDFLQEQGTISNDVLGVGGVGSNGANQTAQVQDDDSIALYGRRQEKFCSEEKEDAPVREAAQAKLDRERYPRFTFRVTALDHGDTFSHLRLGNQLTLHLPDVGFNTKGGIGIEANVRILGMTYDDIVNRVELVLDEVKDE